MSASEGQDGVLRRVRSVGDLPRHPERAHVHSTLRMSESTLDPHNFDSNEAPRIPSSPPTARIVPPITSLLPPLQLDTNANPSPPTLPTETTTPGPPQPQPPNIPLRVRILSFFGLGRRATRARKSLVSVIWNISWGFLQFAAIVPMLILTATHFRSRSDPTLSEWTACERPLGVWTSVWLLRVFLASSLSYWEFRRDRILHPPPAETEAGVVNPTGATDTISGASANGASANSATVNDASTTPPEIPALPHSVLYSRLNLLCSLMTLIWFLISHILEYSSIHTCRSTSPHLWWLVFGILCTMYLMLLEVAILGFVVLVLAPILFIFWNILLFCVGRHPLQHPNMINPEIGKLPKATVDRIPLVIYIPPPPEGVKSALGGIPHSYPPKTTNSPQPRFKLLRGFRKKKSTPQDASDGKNDGTTDTEGSMLWEANWELGEYPFVALEGSRAACAICLMDFEEPKRKEVAGEGSSNPRRMEHTSKTIDDVVNSNISSGENDQEKLKLVDAGDDGQPLRLLPCSHVFHKTCLDPWLTDVSGRCPICQRAVEVSKPSKKKSHRTS